MDKYLIYTVYDKYLTSVVESQPVYKRVQCFLKPEYILDPASPESLCNISLRLGVQLFIWSYFLSVCLWYYRQTKNICSTVSC